LLVAWGDGDQLAFEKLVPLVHSELRRLARRYLGRERPGHTLQTSALVNEAYMRLIDWKNARFENRAHFFGVSSHLMRRILVDFARSRPQNAEGKIQKVALDEALMISNERSADLVALDDALNALAEIDKRKSQIVEMRFFGGMSNEEIAQFLDIAPITVIREWNKAKAWLYRELNRRAEDEG
jgi:RNA polymerase sigma factor (TIGR02999 family)